MCTVTVLLAISVSVSFRILLQFNTVYLSICLSVLSVLFPESMSFIHLLSLQTSMYTFLICYLFCRLQQQTTMTTGKDWKKGPAVRSVSYISENVFLFPLAMQTPEFDSSFILTENCK